MDYPQSERLVMGWAATSKSSFQVGNVVLVTKASFARVRKLYYIPPRVYNSQWNQQRFLCPKRSMLWLSQSS
jgi:hypothetical protein